MHRETERNIINSENQYERFLARLAKILFHPAFSIIVSLILAVLWATNVINIFVACAISIACFIALVWFSRASFMHKLSLSRRLIYLLTAVVILALAGSLFGNWALMQYYKQKQPSQNTESTQQSAVEHSTPTKKLTDRPKFEFYGGGFEIKTIPKNQIETTLINKGKHTALNLMNRQIISDQQFLTVDIRDSSAGNEVPPNNTKTYHCNINAPQVMVPIYFIFAIKYNDEVSPSRTFSQIWCFKTTENWDVINNKNQPPHFSDTLIEERKNIISHFKQELKDYRQ